MSHVWRRGNLHAHTNRTDGEHTVEGLIAAYERLGYDFLAVTDHDLRVPLEEHQARTPMLLVHGVEVTAHGPHIGAVGVTADVPPDPDRQTAIDRALAQDALVILNHPNFQGHYEHWSQEDLARMTGHAGIEIFNGVVQYTPGGALATDRWDQLLSAGQRVWGFANDDTHFAANVANGWNMVRLPADAPVTWPALKAALLAGDFYATTGVLLHDVEWNGTTLRVASGNADRIRFFGAEGRLLASADAAEACFTPERPARYVRAEAYGPRGSVAWTQPVFLE